MSIVPISIVRPQLHAALFGARELPSRTKAQFFITANPPRSPTAERISPLTFVRLCAVLQFARLACFRDTFPEFCGRVSFL